MDDTAICLVWSHETLGRPDVKATGRQGLPAEAVLRRALLKQYRQLSYQELAFHLEVLRLVSGLCPPAVVVEPAKVGAAKNDQRGPALRPGNRSIGRLLSSARQAKLEDGTVVRLDSTVTSALSARTQRQQPARRCRAGHGAPAEEGGYLGRRRPGMAPSLPRGQEARPQIEFTRGSAQSGRTLSVSSIAIACATLAYLQQATERLAVASNLLVQLWQAQVRHYRPLIERIIKQSERRVLAGEPLPASEKLVSLFEPHADIIVKGSREAEYGHKLNLTTGRSGMILDLVIEAGNPPDSERLLPMLERHIALDGQAPRQAAADGGFASRGNLATAKTWGVRDMAFHKKAGLKVEDMVRSNWVYRKLRNFRAGIEAGISCLKRAYGSARCTWRGLDHFKIYVWSSAVAYNLVLFTRLKPT